MGTLPGGDNAQEGRHIRVFWCPCLDLGDNTQCVYLNTPVKLCLMIVYFSIGLLNLYLVVYLKKIKIVYKKSFPFLL